MATKKDKILLELNREDVKALQKLFYWGDVGQKKVKPKVRSFLDSQNYITPKQAECLKQIKICLVAGNLATSKTGFDGDFTEAYLKGKIK